jgi:uncharacterized protein (TIGR02246 family)
MRRRALLGLLLALSIAPDPTLAQAPAPPSSNVADEIARVRERFLAAVSEKDPDEIALLFAPDASIVSGGAPRVTDREAIRDFWEGIVTRFTSESTLARTRFASSGDLAYESGDFAETSVSLRDGKQRHVEGTYLMVFQRQPEGQWLILEQIWVARPQVSGSPAAQ